VDEVDWAGPTQRLAVAIHPHLLTKALDEPHAKLASN